MVLNAKKLLNKRKMKVLADIGYYSRAEIKNVWMENLPFLLKKQKPITKLKIMNTEKNLCTMQIKTMGI